jgi:hypothetical protein
MRGLTISADARVVPRLPHDIAVPVTVSGSTLVEVAVPAVFLQQTAVSPASGMV